MSDKLPGDSTYCAKLDTSTTGNHTMRYAPLLNKKQMNNGITVPLTDNSAMRAIHIGTLNMLLLPAKSRIHFTLPNIAKLLLPIPVVRDEGAEERLMKKEFYID